MGIIKNLLFVCFSFVTLSTCAQSDATKITVAQYALETQHDCSAAAKALNEVSEEGRTQQIYYYYAAKTADCLHNYDEAINFYNKYLEFVPGDAVIVERVAKLSYDKMKSDEKKEQVKARKTEGEQIVFAKSPEFWAGTYIRTNPRINKQYLLAETDTVGNYLLRNTIDTITISVIINSDGDKALRFVLQLSPEILNEFKKLTGKKYNKIIFDMFRNPLDNNNSVVIEQKWDKPGGDSQRDFETWEQYTMLQTSYGKFLIPDYIYRPIPMVGSEGLTWESCLNHSTYYKLNFKKTN